MLTNTKSLQILRDQTTDADYNGVSEEKVREAETALGVKFAPEYKAILKTYGYINNKHRSICGICDDPDLNILELDKRLRANGFRMGEGIYPIQIVVEGIIYVGQDEKGALYTITEHEGPTFLCDSMDDYFMSL